MKTFISAVLVTLVSISTAMASDHRWSAAPVPEIGAAVHIPSERFSATTLIVYVQKEQDCNLRLAVMTEISSNRDIDDFYTGEISARMKVDNNNIWTNEAANTYAGSGGKALFDSLSTLDGKLLGEMLSGNSMIVQVGKEKTNKFSLLGFTKAINKGVSICENMPSEWDTEYSDNEWES